jgi:membrane protein implicated in regulation of membrane protease activity
MGFWVYLLLQVPDILLAALIVLALHRWAGFPLPWAALAFLAWIVKDLAMYPLVRSALAASQTWPETFIGARGVAADSLAPVGYVKLDGELWRAETMGSQQPIPAQASVIVRAVQGFTLLVESEATTVSRPKEGGTHESPVGQPGQSRV